MNFSEILWCIQFFNWAGYRMSWANSCQLQLEKLQDKKILCRKYTDGRVYPYFGVSDDLLAEDWTPATRL